MVNRIGIGDHGMVVFHCTAGVSGNSWASDFTNGDYRIRGEEIPRRVETKEKGRTGVAGLCPV